MRKKIGIVTITDDGNLGNRLQNYAMQVVLSKYGHVSSIKRYYNCEKLSKIKLMSRNKFNRCKIIIKKILGRNYYSNKRLLNFYNFNKNINYSYLLNRNTDYKRINKKYDCFIAGSDQIWNPNIFNDKLEINMLTFADDAKKLAIAPSIAVDALTKKQEKIFKDNLKNFKFLSCREEIGADLIKKIVGKDCISLVDPTLMLSQAHWDKLSRKPKFHDDTKKFMLIYFLGNINEEYKVQIHQISDKFKLEIINISNKNSIYHTCGPSEFLYLIKHCEIMFTDSFHGSVFSYIYNKPFKIFKREDKSISMNSRLTNLIKKLNLNDNIYFKNDLDLSRLFEVEYDKSFLINEQKKFTKYLELYFINK